MKLYEQLSENQSTTQYKTIKNGLTNQEKEKNYYDELLPIFLLDDCRNAYFNTLSKPHMEGDFVYATDSKTAIRIPASFFKNKYEGIAGYPNIAKIFTNAESSKLPNPLCLDIENLLKIWNGIPDVPLKKFIQCDFCNGLGSTICDSCNQHIPCNNPECDEGYIKIDSDLKGKTEEHIFQIDSTVNLANSAINKLLLTATKTGKKTICLTAFKNIIFPIMFGIGEIAVCTMALKEFSANDNFTIHKIITKKTAKKS